MKYTKILAFLVCFAVICSLSQLASCNSDNKGDENAATTTTAANDESTTVAPDVEDEVTTADKNADEDTTKVPEDTDNGNAPTYPADSMSSAECFDFAAEEFFSAFENLKNGFLPEIFGSETQSDGGELTLSVDSISLFGNPILNNAFSASGGYVMNENGFLSEGSLKNQNELEYQLCITPEGKLYVRFPQIDENTFIGLDTNLVLDGTVQGGGIENTGASSVTGGTIFEILDDVFGEATDKLITEESADVTSLGTIYKNARRLSFKYVMTGATADSYGVTEVNAVFYVAKGGLVRAEFELAGVELALYTDILKSSEKMTFASELRSSGEKTLDFAGEQKENSGEVRFSFGAAQTQLGNMGFSLSYARSVSGNVTSTDYALGIVLSAGANELTVAIPIHTQLIRTDDGTVSYKLSIDTVKDKIPEMLAKMCVSFELVRLPESSETVVTMPEITDENTIYVNDESDREALTAYFEAMKAQFPDIKESVLEILKLLGFNIGDGTTYLEGTYAPGGIASIITLTFTADGKATCSVLGYGTDGTYVINGGEITLDFGEGHNLTGTFTFENKDTSIVIDGTEYFKK